MYPKKKKIIYKNVNTKDEASIAIGTRNHHSMAIYIEQKMH